MNCIFAILLRTASNALYKDRLVVAHNHQDSGYYGVFNPPKTNFPIRNISPKIIVTESNTHQPGTYTKLYCSDTEGVDAILKQVINGLQPASPRFYPEFNTIKYVTNTCLVNIHSHAKKNFMSKAVPVSMKKIKGEGKCSDSSIVYLATQGLINLKKNYNTGQSDITASKSADIVIADSLVLMSNVIHDGYFFPGQIQKPNKQALGWFQGDLHVFELDRELKYWNIVTSIYPHNNNGNLIINFLLEFMEEFVMLKASLKIFEIQNPNNFAPSSSNHRGTRKMYTSQFRSIYSSFIFSAFSSEDQKNFLDLTKFYDMKNISPHADKSNTRSPGYLIPYADNIHVL